MNSLVLFMIFVATTVGYLVRMDALPQVTKYLPEIISAFTFLLVAILGTRNRFQFVRPAYWFTFGALTAVIICGVLVNSVPSGPLFAGVRAYLRALPFFFLPAVYAFSERQIRSQLLLLFALSVLQVPIAVWQRMQTAAIGGFSGDRTAGTVLLSGVLSIFLVCGACILAAAFLRKRVKATLFIPLFILILLPTTINETKATVLLLPLGLLTTFLAASPQGTRLKNVVVAASLLTVFGAIFIPVYDYLVSGRKYGVPVVEFFEDPKKMSAYMHKEAEVGATKVGRVDAIVTPLKEMSRDPTHVAFGLGIGNVSESSMGSAFNGRYFLKFQPFLKSAASVFILEIGILGLALALTIDYLIFRDSRVVADVDSGVMGTLAAGWVGVTSVTVMSTFYVNVAASSTIAYLFWYFSGVIAAHRVRLSSERARHMTGKQR